MLILVLAASGCGDNRSPQPQTETVESIDPDAAVPAPVGYAVYENDRYGYSVAYPESLLSATGLLRDGAGRWFASEDSIITLAAIGRPRTAQDSAEALFQERLRFRRDAGGLVTYSTQRDSAFVVSGTRGTQIYYEKTIFLGDGVARIELTYPIRMREAMDSVVTYVSHSFGGRIW